MNIKKVLFKMSSLYIALLILSVALIVLIIPRFEDVGHLERGCYLTDAMVPYVECRVFLGHKVVKFLVNLPYQLIYLPLFGVAGFMRAPWLIVLGILAWAPIGYFTWYLLKQPNKRH